MILDALQSQRCSVKVSYFDAASDKIKKGSLSVFEGEPLFWTISNPSVTSASITVSFIDPLILEDLKFHFSANPTVSCYYSIDGYSWDEFNYYTYTVSDDVTVEYDLVPDVDPNYQHKILMGYADMLFKVDAVPVPASQYMAAHTHKKYTIYNPLSGRAVAIPPSDYEIIAAYLGGSFEGAGPVSTKYSFRVVDGASGTDRSIYNTMPVKHIQLRLNNIDHSVGPMSLLQLEIPTSVAINIEDTCLSAYTGSLYKQRYFEDYPFIPSMAKTFFEMLETSEHEIEKNPHDITVDFKVDPTTFKITMNITPQVQLGAYFNPVFVWTVGPIGSTRRFVYTSLQDTWTDVDNYLASNIPNWQDMYLEFAILTSPFNFNKSITYDLTQPYTGTGWTS